jgi:hypothetical protein
VKQDVSVRLLSAPELEELQKAFSSTPKVTIGVLSVEWSDGTAWAFDLPDGATDFSTGNGRIVAAQR